MCLSIRVVVNAKYSVTDLNFHNLLGKLMLELSLIHYQCLKCKDWGCRKREVGLSGIGELT